MNALIIQKCEITSFGCVSNKIVTPKAGLNVITAPNESGKTTLAHFIKFMFYGFAGQRSAGVSDNEKKHYIPWDNPRASGALDFSLGGVNYRIEREYLAGKDICTVTEKDTGKEILKNQIPGEFFFGVKEEIFSKTSFFRQLSVPGKKDDELAEQLRNLIYSADESVSASDGMKKLTEAKNRLRSRVKNTGIIPDLEATRAHYDKTLNESLSATGALGVVDGEIKKLEENLSANNRAREEIKKELSVIEKHEAFVKYEEMKEHARKVTEAQQEYDQTVTPFEGKEPEKDAVEAAVKLLAKRNSCIARVEERKNSLKDAETALATAKKESLFDGKDTIVLGRTITLFKVFKVLITLLTAVLATGSVVVWLSWYTSLLGDFRILSSGYMVVFAVGFGVSTLLSIVINAFSNNYAHKNGFTTLTEMRYMLDQYPVAQQEIQLLERRAQGAGALLGKAEEELKQLDAEIFSVTENMPGDNKDVTKRVGDIVTAYDLITRAKSKLDTVKAVQEAAFASCDLKALSEIADENAKPDYTREQLAKALEMLDLDDEKQSRALREKDGERGRLVGAGGYPSLIQTQRNAVERKIRYLEQAYSAILIASEVLDEADKHMRNTVSPELSNKAGEYMSKVTAGKYSSVSFDTSLIMSYETPMGTKHSDYMSAGTRDSAYMCLRLALVDLLYSDTVPPLVLDDAFVRLDGKRLSDMLSLVSEAANNGQVFLFTCHDREEKALEDKNIEFNRIIL